MEMRLDWMLRDEDGQGMVEYCLMIILVALVAMTGLTGIAPMLIIKFNAVVAALV